MKRTEVVLAFGPVRESPTELRALPTQLLRLRWDSRVCRLADRARCGLRPMRWRRSRVRWVRRTRDLGGMGAASCRRSGLLSTTPHKAREAL